jgi:membrane protein YqaA with SNARE-associated domain
MHRSFLKNFWTRLKTKHRKNKEKGVYGYMWKTSFKIILIYLLVMIPAVLIGKYLIDLNAVFKFITGRLPDMLVLIVFLLSESLLGMIPPDFFVIWTAKFNAPFLFLIILGVLSYIGGAISYLIGYWLSKRERIRAYSERVLDRYINMVRKWGGVFIIISALFPFSPFSMVVIAVSLFKYPFRMYLLFGLSRIARFIIQGVFYLDVLKIDSILNRM